MVIVEGILWRALGLLFGLALGALIVPDPVFPAEWKDCEALAGQVDRMVVAATGDLDMMQYIHDRAFAHCLLLDEMPLKMILQDHQAVPAPGDKPKLSAWEITCRQRYKSFDSGDGTVLRYGSKKRVPCPVPR